MRAAVAPMNRPDRLLVVDDLLDNLFLVRAILEEEGYDIETATSGPEALAAIANHPPDLVLLDVMMPGMDGYEVTRRLRAMADLPFIPILLITAFDRADAVKGLDLGADEFIRKPIEAEELLARVRSLLRLKHSIAERDRIARERQDWVSRLTHDMRTPLVAADRMLGLLLDGALGDLTPEVKEALTVMARSNQNLLEMANQLLEVYRYEAGSKQIALQPLDLGEIVVQAVEALRPIARSKHLDLEVNPAPSAIIVAGDRLELLRVCNNLIGNALKFTDRGSVRVTVERAGNEACVRVCDTGPGIPASERAQLFQRFRQGSHQKQGSGLGLYLSQYIASAHGGTITVECPPAGGSCFTLHLPWRSPAPATAPETLNASDAL